MTRTNASHGTILLAGAVFLGLTSASAVAQPKGQMGPTDVPTPQNMAAPNAPFTVDGKNVELKTYFGHPLVVWQVATWCKSCESGLETFANHLVEIGKSDAMIIVLRDYGNGGYPGPGIREFTNQVAPQLLSNPHFVFGEDTKELFDLYNPHHYVDVFLVIAPDGHIALVSSTPSTTFDKIDGFIKPKTGS